MTWLSHADGFESRLTCKHVWQPVSFVFETELLEWKPAKLDADLRHVVRADIRPSARQPDIDAGRVYCVCMKCASHTYVVTAFAGFYLGGDRPLPNEEKPSVDDVIRSIPPTPKRGDCLQISDVQTAMTGLQTSGLKQKE